jgi:hypothetical protein
MLQNGWRSRRAGDFRTRSRVTGSIRTSIGIYESSR